MLPRLRLIAQHMAITLTYKIKATGSQQSGEIMVLVFFVFLWCCFGYVYALSLFSPPRDSTTREERATCGG